MLTRFSAYGFLKNQRYFEPFIVLALLAKGLSFLDVGLLFALKELVVNLIEIPSGAWADSFGRRRLMIASSLAYLLSFVVFGSVQSLPGLALAMVAYAFGDAFRTGTHKAMIFAWLRARGRGDDRTEVYGFTRSWSKRGSAVSGLVSAALVLALDDLDIIFYAACLPYLLNVVNFMGYPPEVELDGGRASADASQRRPIMRAWGTTRRAFSTRSLRHVLFESMGFEGVFHAIKDYLQPVLLAASVQWIAGGSLSAVQRSALLIGPIYFALFMAAAAASRRAHRFSAWAGGESRAAGRLWILGFVSFAALGLGAWQGWVVLTVLGFVAAHVLQNLWRPILVSRIDGIADGRDGATLLSVESQSRRLATMVLAPLVGWMVDVAGSVAPIGVLGAAIALGFVMIPRAGHSLREAPTGASPGGAEDDGGVDGG
jgi:MFS family permease